MIKFYQIKLTPIRLKKYFCQMDIVYTILEIIQHHYLLILAFFGTAVLYASVGFGGGSSYAALLSLTGLPYLQFRAISLLCNIAVVSNGTVMYAKNKLLDWKKVLPLVLLSVPFSFLGGFMKIEKQVFYVFLGISLLLVGILMLFSKYLVPKDIENNPPKSNFYKNALIGGLIGFISGIVGIGGGVFLAPFLHLTRWDSSKKIAATTSFFILVNSVSGILGQILNPSFVIDYYLSSVLIISVFLGGLIGSRLSTKTFDQKTIKQITAVLIVFVGIKVLFFS